MHECEEKIDSCETHAGCHHECPSVCEEKILPAEEKILPEEPVKKKIKLMIATPAFEGKVHIPYALALSDTCSLLRSQGIDIEYRITASGSLIVAERNRLMKMFMESDCTHILCIDSDLGWPPIGVKMMLDADKDFICGLYPTREGKMFLYRPEYDDATRIKMDDKGLLKMLFVPSGFMLIKREVIQKIIDQRPDLYFEPKDASIKETNKGYMLFNTEIYDGEFWGEDFTFCRRVREAGFELWCDPNLHFNHAGVMGCIKESLANSPITPFLPNLPRC